MKVVDIDIQEAIKEQKAKEVIEMRDEESKVDLCIRRSYTIFLTILVLVGGWTGIAFVFYYEHSFYTMFS